MTREQAYSTAADRGCHFNIRRDHDAWRAIARPNLFTIWPEDLFARCAEDADKHDDPDARSALQRIALDQIGVAIRNLEDRELDDALAYLQPLAPMIRITRQSPQPAAHKTVIPFQDPPKGD